MATLFVDKLDPQSGTALEIGTSGDTVTVPSGATFNVAGTLGSALTNTPAFHAYRSSSQSLSTTTMNKVEFDTEVFDTAGAYDKDTNYRFTPQTAGKYVVYATVFTGGASSGSSTSGGFITNIKKNGSDASYNAFYLYNNTTGVDGSKSASIVLDMNGSSDYVECFTYSRQNTTSIAGAPEYTYFGSYKLIGV